MTYAEAVYAAALSRINHELRDGIIDHNTAEYLRANARDIYINS